MQVAVGRRPVLRIFGTDYEDTSDGTAVRDYVHVMDVATGHSVALLEMFKDTYDGGARTYNLGIGRGDNFKLSFMRKIQHCRQKSKTCMQAPPCLS